MVLDIEAGTSPARSHIHSFSNVYFVERTITLAKRFVAFEAGEETRKQCRLIASFEKLAEIVLDEIELRRPIENEMTGSFSIVPLGPNFVNIVAGNKSLLGVERNGHNLTALQFFIS